MGTSPTKTTSIGEAAALPSSPEQLTPEFLTSTLQAVFPGARVRDCRRETLTGERGITSALTRLQLVSDDPAVPTTMIAKLPPAHPGTRQQLHAMGFFAREVGFYRTLADLTPVPTPVCYGAEIDRETGAALLLIEDLAAARNGSSVEGSTVDEVAVVLLALARVHARWWEHPAVVDVPWLTLTSALAPSVVAQVFEQGWQTFLERSSILLDEILATKDWISSTLLGASTALFETGPRTLVHNDLQADNLFFTDDPARPVVFVDWQMATYGRCVIDVANAIQGNLPRSLRRSAEAELLCHYHEALVRAGVRDYPWERCRADYELATVIAPGRLASAVGHHPGLAAHPGAPWDTVFPRFTRA